VTLDAAGERLGPAMAEFHQHLRAQRTAKPVAPTTADRDGPEPEVKSQSKGSFK
jgi:hypothetical protein